MEARIKFDDNPEHDIVIPDISKFEEGKGMIKLPSGEQVTIQNNEPVQVNDNWIYTVKLVTNNNKQNGTEK